MKPPEKPGYAASIARTVKARFKRVPPFGTRTLSLRAKQYGRFDRYPRGRLGKEEIVTVKQGLTDYPGAEPIDALVDQNGEKHEITSWDPKTGRAQVKHTTRLYFRDWKIMGPQK